MSSGVRRDAAQLDRSAGVALGSAVGDALGAGYEFATPPAPGQALMIGGGLGNFEVGEWTDDTAQAVPILQAAAAGLDLRTRQAHDVVVRGWLTWWDGRPSDIGVHTAGVFAHLGNTGRTAELADPSVHVRNAAEYRHGVMGRSAGNGALMRTGPVALAHLDDPAACAAAAAAVAGLTHPDPLAAEACVIWCEGVRQAVLSGTFAGVRAGVALLPEARHDFWTDRLDEAQLRPPGSFGDNGFVVVTLQDAWSAICHSEQRDARHFGVALDAAVGAGNDTDTVAAVAGALLGARWGASAVPQRWRRLTHGWPGLTGSDLAALAVRAARGGSDDANGWPSGPTMLPYYAANWNVREVPVAHPDDDGLLVGTSATLAQLAPGGALEGQVDVVVSLCRLGRDDVPAGVEKVEVWLVDTPDPAANPNLEVVLDDTADTIADLRAQGKRVLLHCVAAESRTPTVAALYGSRLTGTTALQSLARLQALVVQARPNAAFMSVLTARSC